MGAGYFFLYFDPSVEVPTTEVAGMTVGGGRVVKGFLRNVSRFLSAIFSRLKGKQGLALGKLIIAVSRTGAEEVARSGHFVVVAPDGHQKWAVFVCPCGCGELVTLNLMQSQRPFWKLESTDGQYSLSPSVDSQTCRAHYWVRDGRITWC